MNTIELCDKTLLLFEQSCIERQRQQDAQTRTAGFAAEVRKNDLEVAAELPQDLPAGAAGWRGRSGVGDHGDSTESSMSFRQCLEHGHTLGAHGEAVCRVLDVAPGHNRAVGSL